MVTSWVLGGAGAFQDGGTGAESDRAGGNVHVCTIIWLNAQVYNRSSLQRSNHLLLNLQTHCGMEMLASMKYTIKN